MSVQTVSPVPVYPLGQGLHTRPPTVFVQVDKTLQPPLPVAHSLMSVQLVLPVPEYPAGQAPQVTVPERLVQVASGAQPPWLTAQGSPASIGPPPTSALTSDRASLVSLEVASRFGEPSVAPS